MNEELVLSLLLFELGLLIYIERRLTKLETEVKVLVKFIRARTVTNSDDGNTG
ncbi:MAG: hypothetical protein QXN57_05660 [Desulfurococcaceae archaeon]